MPSQVKLEYKPPAEAELGDVALDPESHDYDYLAKWKSYPWIVGASGLSGVQAVMESSNKLSFFE